MNQKKKRFFSVVTTAALVSTVFASLPNEAAASGFPDVEETQYYYEAIHLLKERGVVDGYPDGTFKPAGAVTRGQAAKMLANVLGLYKQADLDISFSDVPAEHLYAEAISALATAGIITGYPDGTFRPDEVIERRHMAKMMAGLFVNVAIEEGQLPALPFTDLSPEYAEAVAIFSLM